MMTKVILNKTSPKIVKNVDCKREWKKKHAQHMRAFPFREKRYTTAVVNFSRVDAECRSPNTYTIVCMCIHYPRYVELTVHEANM